MADGIQGVGGEAQFSAAAPQSKQEGVLGSHTVMVQEAQKKEASGTDLVRLYSQRLYSSELSSKNKGEWIEKADVRALAEVKKGYSDVFTLASKIKNFFLCLFSPEYRHYHSQHGMDWFASSKEKLEILQKKVEGAKVDEPILSRDQIGNENLELAGKAKHYSKQVNRVGTPLYEKMGEVLGLRGLLSRDQYKDIFTLSRDALGLRFWGVEKLSSVVGSDEVKKGNLAAFSTLGKLFGQSGVFDLFYQSITSKGNEANDFKQAISQRKAELDIERFEGKEEISTIDLNPLEEELIEELLNQENFCSQVRDMLGSLGGTKEEKRTFFCDLFKRFSTFEDLKEKVGELLKLSLEKKT